MGPTAPYDFLLALCDCIYGTRASGGILPEPLWKIRHAQFESMSGYQVIQRTPLLLNDCPW